MKQAVESVLNNDSNIISVTTNISLPNTPDDEICCDDINKIVPFL